MAEQVGTLMRPVVDMFIAAVEEAMADGDQGRGINANDSG
jgi:hypothetical protein